MTSATYAGTTGHSGTDTSRAQAEPHKHARVQDLVLLYIGSRGQVGATIADLRAQFDYLHHGSLSSALTNLHRDGRLARLVDKRDRCHIYVLPVDVGDRPVEQPTASAYRGAVPSDAQARLNELAREEGHALGWSEGEARGRQEASSRVVQHIDAMRAALGHSQATHSDNCWQRHVACALTRVRHEALKAGS